MSEIPGPGPSSPEFSRKIDVREIGDQPLHLSANAGECAALARRFDLVAVVRLEAIVVLERAGKAVQASGRLTADIVQSCAVSGEDLPVHIDEPVQMRFVLASRGRPAEAEIEISAQDCDEIPFDGISFDLGEEIAQSLGVAIDPFATGPLAEEARRRAGLLDADSNGPFAALAALRKRVDQ